MPLKTLIKKTQCVFRRLGQIFFCKFIEYQEQSNFTRPNKSLASTIKTSKKEHKKYKPDFARTYIYLSVFCGNEEIGEFYD